MWLYPDGSRVLELSTRCGTSEAFQVAAELVRSSATGIDISGEQADEDAKGARVLRVRTFKVRAMASLCRPSLGVADLRRSSVRRERFAALTPERFRRATSLPPLD